MKTVPAAWAKARGSSRSYKIKSKSSRLPPLLQGVEALAVAFDLAIRGPPVAAEAADTTRSAAHRDVRRFPRGQDGIGRAHDGSPVTNEQLACLLLLKKKYYDIDTYDKS